MDAARVPGPLRTAAAWSWRLLLVGVALYAAWRVARVLYVVVVPCAAALLAVILALAVGSVIAGIAGAVVAVPIVAVVTRVVPELRRPAQPVSVAVEGGE